MKISLSCPECQKEFQLENWDYQKRLRLGRTIIYCSKGCASINSNKNRAEHKTLKCQGCGKEQEVLASDWREKYCSKECYFEHDKERLQEFARRVGKESAQKISETKKEMYASGELKPSFFGKTHSEETKNKLSESRKEYYENNDGYWKGKILSEECKQKMSETRTKKWINGDYDHLKMAWAKGRYFFKKANKEVYYRSSWELKFMQYLDAQENIIKCEYEMLRIPYVGSDGEKRNYIPDILAYYVDGSKILYEIKPIMHKDSEINKLKFFYATAHCQQNNITFRVLTQKELKEMGIL